jgi:O-antigen/teichoic acid export membrane protein
MTIIKRQTVLGTIYSYAGVIVGTLTQAFLIPNFLTLEQNGLLAMLMSWMFILVFVAGLGFNNSGIKFFDFFRDEKKRNKGYLFTGVVFLAVGLFICFLILLIFKKQIINSSAGDNLLFEKYYYYIIPITGFVALFNLFDNYAKGLYDTVRGSFLSQFLQRFLIFLAVLVFITELVSLDRFILLWVIGISLPSLLMFIHISQLGGFSLKPSNHFIKSDFKSQFFQFAGFSMLTGLSSIVITKLDTLMVYDYLGLGQTGIYNTCLLFGSVMTISYNVSMKASTAIVLDAMKENDMAKVQQIFTKSSVTQLILGMGLLMVVWVNVDLLFSFIRPEYAAGKYVLLIIGAAKLYDLASGINTLILAYSKYYKLDSLLVLTFVGLLFLLNHLLIPRYGLNGAAFAAFLSIVYYNSARNYLIWRFFKIHPYRWNLLYVLIIGVALILIGQYLPLYDETLFGKFVSMAYTTFILGSTYLIVVYKLKLSVDLNGLVDKFLEKL